MNLAKITYLLIIIVSDITQVDVAANVYCVVASRNESLLCPPNSVRNDLFGYIASGTFNVSDVSFIFMPGIHYLNTSLIVKDSERLSLFGRTTTDIRVSSYPIIECVKMWTIGLVLIDTSEVTFQNIAFINCSQEIEAYDFKYHFAAVFFQRGKDLNLLNVHFVNGAFYIKNTKGGILMSNVTVDSYIFTKCNTNGIVGSIGGSFLRFTSGCDDDFVNLTIAMCNFTFFNTEEVCISTDQSSQAVTLILYCTNVRVTIIRSQFSGFNGLNDGGNMQVILQNSAHSYQNPIVFSNCLFNKGSAIRGGALYISLVQVYNVSTAVSTSSHSIKGSLFVTFLDTNFTANSARLAGAAVYIVQKESYTSTEQVLSVHFQNCVFSHNFLLKDGHGGIAIHVLQFMAMKYLKYSRPQYNTTLNNCLLQRNFINYGSYNTAGNGVVTVIRNSLFMLINTTLVSNNCTAVLAVGTNLVFQGLVNISNNNGSSGGGLMFCDETIMFLKPFTHVHIVNNTVTHAGGGICVDSQCLQTKPMCFFQYTSEVYSNHSLQYTIQVELKGNRAKKYAGHNLFGGFVDRCFMLDSPKSNSPFINGSEAFHRLFVVNLNVSSSVTSIPLQVCFCNGDSHDCSQKTHTANAYPGQLFYVDVVIVGQLEGLVSGSVRTLDKVLKDRKQMLQKVYYTDKCTKLEYTIFSNKPKDQITLFVDHDGDISAYIHFRFFAYKYIHVTLLECPVGFERVCESSHNFSTCKCDCIKKIKTDLALSCCIKHQEITKVSGGWIGYIPDPYINEANTEHRNYIAMRKICPLDYCINNNVTLTSTNSSIDQDKQCQFNRTGILCGSCPDDLSVIFGTSDCWECSNKSLVLIIIFALFGVLLIAFLTVTNLTVSEGTIGGLIFYANVVQIGSTVFFPPTDRTILTMVLKTFISWINLDFGIPACLYNGMDAYTKAWLQFVFPLYLWVLSGVIVFLCNRYIIVTRVFGQNSVKVLSTVILLSFTKLLRSVTTTMSFVDIKVILENKTVSRRLWLNDANVLFLQGKHIVLFIAGLIFAIICAMFLFYLLFIQFLQRFRSIQRIKPFTDCYTGPNTSSGRFWTGLLLLSRVVLLTIWAGILSNEYTSWVIGVTSALFVIKQLIPVGLYSKNIHNILENLFLFNLIILCTKNVDHMITWSGCITLVIFSGILLYHCLQRLRNTQCWTILRNISGRRRNSTTMLIVSQMKEQINGRCNTLNYRKFDQDREPLLASASLPSHQ